MNKFSDSSLLTPYSSLSAGVSIIVLTKDGAPLLDRLLSSFFEVNTYSPVEWIIVDHDNSSSDSSQFTTHNSQLTGDIIAKYISKAFIRHIKRGRNHSFAESCNYGASKAKYPNLLFLNNDIIYTSDVLPRAVDVLEKDESIGAVGVRLDDVHTEAPPPNNDTRFSPAKQRENPSGSDKQPEKIRADSLAQLNGFSDSSPKGIQPGCRFVDQNSSSLSSDVKVQHTGIHFVWNEKRGYHQPEQIRHPSLKDFLSGSDKQPEKIRADSCRFVDKNSSFFPAITGAFMLLRKSDFQQLSGFDESYNYGLEDVDFCLRLGRDLQKKCFCINEIGLQHVEMATRNTWSTQERSEIIENNHQIFKEKWDGYLREIVVNFNKTYKSYSNKKPVDHQPSTPRNILIFLDPHPIRNRTEAFLSVGKKISSIFNDPNFHIDHKNKYLDIRFYGNQDTLNRLLQHRSGLEQFFIWPTEKERKIFDAYFVDWVEEGCAIWKKLLLGEGDVTNDYVDVLSEINNRYEFDCIIHWGDNGAVKKYCNKNKITRIVIELGCSRQPYLSSVCFDPMGANGGASIAQVSIESIEKAINDDLNIKKNKYLQILESNHQHTNSQIKVDSSDIEHEILKSVNSKPVAFIPLQLHDDANMLIYSDFESPADFLQQSVSKLINNGYFCIIKPHPSTTTRPGGWDAYQKAHAEALKYKEDALWIDETNEQINNKILHNLSDLVVTVNSSVGFEALYHNKIVTLLGKAVYKPAKTFPSLDDAIKANLDIDRYNYKTSVLKDYFLSSYLVDEQEAFSYKIFKFRVDTINNLWRKYESDLGQYISHLYKAFSKPVFSCQALN